MPAPAPRSGYLEGGPVPIFWQAWRTAAPAGPPVVVAHGKSEHSGRYAHVAAFLNGLGLPVWALDHRGHGRSGGARVYVDRFQDYLDDLHRFVGHVTRAEGARPILLGHSMGGLISIRYAQDYPGALIGLALSSPFLGLGTPVPLPLRLAAPLLSALAPRLPIRQGANVNTITRDPEVWQRYVSDPLVHIVATPRWFTACLREHAVALARAERLALPTLFLVAGSDLLVDPAATRALYERVPGPKRWHLYPDRYHEVFNDYGHAEVLRDLGAWMAEQGWARAGTQLPVL